MIGPVVILVPVLRRPHRVQPLLESIAAATSAPHSVLFISDTRDTDEHRAVREHGAEMLMLDGTYAQKVNAAIAVTPEPLIFLGADDIDFHAGWLEAAAAHVSDTIGLVGTQDLCNPRVIAGEHSTHFLMARWYAEQPTIDGQPGPVCELYPHEFTDDELVGTAKHRGAWAFADDSIVEHLHPDVGKAPMDDLYAGRRKRMRQGRYIFEGRRHLWET